MATKKTSSSKRPVRATGRKTTSWPPDVREALQAAIQTSGPDGKPLIDPSKPAVIARAPGRLDIMGGIGDYSGCKVLEWPIAQAAIAVVQITDSPTIAARSAELRERGVPDGEEEVQLELEILAPFSDYAEFRNRLPASPGARWASYVLGAFAVLIREREARFTGGTRIFIDSRVPTKKGVASSAAVEVAALLALAKAHGIRLEPGEVPALAQLVENQVAGAPCGIMDQITAYCGKEGMLLPIICQPGQPLPPLRLPPGVEVSGIDSGVRHDVGGTQYRTARTGAAMGYRMISDLLRLMARPAGPGRVEIKDPLLNGYLANLEPTRFEREFVSRLPEQISGKNFLDCFSGVADPESTVDPSMEYPVRAATSHPVYENFRVKAFSAILGRGAPIDRDSLQVAGELMLMAHESYNRCGLGDACTDLLVELAMSEGPTHGIYGAKSSGGGSGGTVVLLHDRKGRAAISRISLEYGKKTGNAPLVVRGSSSGARAFGVHRIPPRR